MARLAVVVLTEAEIELVGRALAHEITSERDMIDDVRIDVREGLYTEARTILSSRRRDLRGLCSAAEKCQRASIDATDARIVRRQLRRGGVRSR